MLLRLNSLCYFFENWLMKLKCQNLLKPLGTLTYQNSQFYYPSNPFSFHHFTMRHPVVQDSSNFFAKLAAKNNVAVNWLFGKRLNSIFYWQLKTIKENYLLCASECSRKITYSKGLIYRKMINLVILILWHISLENLCFIMSVKEKVHTTICI